MRYKEVRPTEAQRESLTRLLSNTEVEGDLDVLMHYMILFDFPPSYISMARHKPNIRAYFIKDVIGWFI